MYLGSPSANDAELMQRGCEQARNNAPTVTYKQTVMQKLMRAQSGQGFRQEEEDESRDFLQTGNSVPEGVPA
jgi:hypothetical protein